MNITGYNAKFECVEIILCLLFIVFETVFNVILLSLALSPVFLVCYLL